VRRDKPLAPAMHQAHASSLAMARAVDNLGETPLKTQSFRCRQSVQAPRRNRELSSLLIVLGAELITLPHHSSKEILEGSGDSPGRLTRCQRSGQNWRAKTQVTRSWWMVSSSWSHRAIGGIDLDAGGYDVPVCQPPSSDYEQSTTRGSSTC
jgi:hypothetical protein